MAGLNFKKQWCHWINEHCTFQSQNAAQMSLCECVSEGNRLSSETCHWHFHFILPIMPDKAAYMSAVLLCVQPLPEKPLYLLLKRHLMAESEFAFPVFRSYVQVNTNIDPCFYAANIVVNVKEVNVSSKNLNN